MREREKAFLAAVKPEARTRGWRCAGGFLFRQDGDWFACVMPVLQRAGGVAVGLELKPMALDSLFWDIAGLPENEALPLSIRANGVWVLRAPDIASGTVGEDASDVETLARLTLAWADSALAATRDTRSLEQMLSAVAEEADPAHDRLALATCLHILSGDLDAALALCQPSSPESSFLDESGGYLMSAPDGSFLTFQDLARLWIAARRSAALKLV